jgi:hypothetical protein
MSRMRGFNAGALPGLIAFVVGAGLLAAPWWSKTLPASDYPLVIVLGAVFAGIGAYAALPDSWPRLRTFALTVFMATFGTICAALALTPLHPDADGTYRIGGVAGFATSVAMPMWARLVATFFAIVFLVVAALGIRGLICGSSGRDTNDGET